MRAMLVLLLLGAPSTASEPALGFYRWANGTANVDAFAA